MAFNYQIDSNRKYLPEVIKDRNTQFLTNLLKSYGTKHCTKNQSRLFRHVEERCRLKLCYSVIILIIFPTKLDVWWLSISCVHCSPQNSDEDLDHRLADT